MKAILYLRFSPRADESTSESNETQRKICRAFCASKGWPVAPEHEFEDVALSGKEINRPKLWAAVAAVERGDVLVVTAWDRIARDVYISLRVERDVLEAGGTLASVSGGTIHSDMSPADELVVNAVRSADQYNMRITQAKTKAAMQSHMKDGRLMGQLPFGKKIDPVNVFIRKKDGKKMPMMIDSKYEIALGLLVVGLHMSGLSANQITKMKLKFRNDKPLQRMMIERILEREKA